MLREYETCGRCGREQRLAWSVDDSLWKLAGLKREGDLLCLECFIVHCLKIDLAFHFAAFRFFALPHEVCIDGDILDQINYARTDHEVETDWHFNSKEAR